MKIMSWNIKNGGAVFHSFDIQNKPILSNIDNILDTIRKEDPDILVLQEFQYQYWDQLIENGLKKDGYRYFQYYGKYLEESTIADGVLICNKIEEFPVIEPIEDIKPYPHRNWYEVEVPGKNLRLLAVDVPGWKAGEKPKEVDTSEMQDFLDKLTMKFMEYKKLKTPAAILGDFYLHIDANGSQSELSEYLTLFEKTLQSLVKGITCGNHQNDYIFGNAAFVDLVQPGHEKPVPTSYSDHNYLIVEIK